MNNLTGFLLGFKKGMHDFGYNFILIINVGLLSTVYFIGIGPISILAKIFKKHFLQREVSEDADTYWKNMDLKNKSIDNYYKQF